MVVRSWLMRPRPCAQDVYGRDGWPFLEDSCYSVVQDALFEMQEEQDKLQLQAVQQPQQEDGDTDGDDGGGGDDDDDEAQVSELAHVLIHVSYFDVTALRVVFLPIYRSASAYRPKCSRLC